MHEVHFGSASRDDFFSKFFIFFKFFLGVGLNLQIGEKRRTKRFSIIWITELFSISQSGTATNLYVYASGSILIEFIVTETEN